MLGTQEKSRQVKGNVQSVSCSYQRDLSPLCTKRKFPLTFGAIKNVLYIMRRITINIADCHSVEVWQATCSLCKGHRHWAGPETKRRKRTK